jgi:hypothetical protein
VPSHENAGRTTEQCTGVDAKQEPFHQYLFADERKHFFIVHQDLLPITTGHKREAQGKSAAPLEGTAGDWEAYQ